MYLLSCEVKKILDIKGYCRYIFTTGTRNAEGYWLRCFAFTFQFPVFTLTTPSFRNPQGVTLPRCGDQLLPALSKVKTHAFSPLTYLAF